MKKIKELSTKVLILVPWWKDLLFAIPQRSILGPILFNKLLCNFLLLIKDVDFACHPDYNTLYNAGDNIN